ncbi:radical SAM protein, partial [bacterium]|nr:radical SAM protein [bacterium]
MSERPRILSLIPPLVQVNTPYPATSFITGFLRKIDYTAVQDDLGLKLVLRLLSSSGMGLIRESILARAQESPQLLQQDSIRFFLEAFSDYERTIEPVVGFLQGRDPTLAHRIAARTLLPEGPRFQSVEEDDLSWAFGLMGTQDQAKHLASLYIDDLTDVISQGVDPEFSLSRYGEKLAASAPSFDPLLSALRSDGGLIAKLINELTQDALSAHHPDVVLITVPFPGCMLGALRIAKRIKALRPEVRIGIGGGYVNTELRKLRDGRIFQFIDAITLDDGERPLELLLHYWSGKIGRESLLRTFLPSEKVKGSVEYCNQPSEHDHPQLATGYPTLEGLPIGSYLSL